MGGNSSELPPTSMSLRWLRSEINQLRMDVERRASREWVEAKLEALKGNEDDTRQIAITAREKASLPHVCGNSDRMADIEDRLSRWDSWWRGIMAAVISAVVIVGGAVAAAWYRTETLQVSVTSVSADVTELKSSIVSIQRSQEQITKVIEESERSSREEEARRAEELQKALRDAVRDGIQVMRQENGIR